MSSRRIFDGAPNIPFNLNLTFPHFPFEAGFLLNVNMCRKLSVWTRYIEKCEIEQTVKEKLVQQILQGLGLVQAAVTKRWP